MRKIALLLAFILILTTVLISCDNTNEEITKINIADKESEEFEYTLDSVPELDYGKKEFGLFGCRGTMPFVMAEEETGDLVNDAVFRRNGTIEDRYNLKFEMFEAEPNKGTDMIKNFVMSGDTTYKIYQGVQHQGMPGMILDNYFVNWNDMSAVHYDMPYWNSNVANTINYGGKVYTMSGDLNLKGYNSTNCIMFNKNLFDDLGIDYPYEDVYNKEWTVDKFIEIVKQGYSDLNGDTAVDTAGDRMGFSGWGYEMSYAMYIGLGGQSVINDANKNPVLAINNENTARLFDKIIEIFDGRNAFINYTDSALDRGMFSDGRLLMRDSFITALAENRNSTYEFGILPYPMLDTNQENYRSRAANIAPLIYVPTTNTEFDATGIVLEAMSIESYNKIRPVYYDITLDLKSASDEETVDMVDMILETSTHLYEGFMEHSFINKVATSQTNTFASWYAQKERGFKKQLEKIEKFYIGE